MAELGPPPPGGDQNRAPELLGITWAFNAAALLLVGFRLVTRHIVIRNPGWDDYLIYASVLLSTVNTAFFTAAANNGLGRHAYYLSPEQQMETVRLQTIANPFGLMAFALPKISVAILLTRIMAPTKWRKRSLFAVSISVLIFTIICDILLFAQCSPSRSLWNPMISHTCWPNSVLTDFTIFVGCFSAFADFYLAFFPVTVLYNLQVKKSLKFGVCGVMSLGALAGICAIVKTTYLPALGDHADYPWAIVDLSIWTSIEGNVIIIAACLPTLRPLIRVIAGKPPHTQPKYTEYQHFNTNNTSATKQSYDATCSRNDDVHLSSAERGVIDPVQPTTKEPKPAREAHELPPAAIRATTEVKTEWEAV